jgi:putative two-component system response regulator
LAKVLVVDDERSVLEVLRKILEQAGHEVWGAVDGEEALALLYQKPIDLVIADILMPKMDGLELVRRIKVEPRMAEVPVMILTAKGAAETRIEGYRRGVDDFLTKPFNREELVLRANRLLKLRQEKLSMYQKLFELGLKVSVQEELLRVGKGGGFVSAYFDLQQMSLDVVRSLALALDARDHYTRGHSEWVAKYSVQIARALSCSDQDVEKLELAALLHDVGKIGVRDSILRKPAKLSREEFAAVQRHPVSSAEIIQPVAYLRELVPAVRHHHERYDGKGYPEGLTGEAIPFSARIITVADAFEAMTSDRPYRKALSFEKAMAEIRRCRGSQFDPVIVEAFLSLTPTLKEQTEGRYKGEKEEK